MDGNFGLFADCPDDELEQLHILDVFEDEQDVANNLKESKINVYRPLKEGSELCRAIKSGNQARIDGVLAVYQSDFEKVERYLTSKYQWNVQDRFWLRKKILIADSVEQCQSVKQLENLVPSEYLEQAVFVLLLNPIDDESIAVIHPNDSNRLTVFRTISELIPNGFLSWNGSDLNGHKESFIETAASCGNNATISRLLDLGAELSLPHQNPLLAACSKMRKPTIQWLLTEHFDDFDCTARNASQTNAFMILMHKNNVNLLDFVLKKMIAYRQKYNEETESEAFSQICRFENEDLSTLSCFTSLVEGPVHKRISEYVTHYKLDLTYRWRNVTMLMELLHRKIAWEYCLSEMRRNPELLGMVVHEDNQTTVAHECVRIGMLDALKELYERKPEVKKYFETDQGFAELRQAIAFKRLQEARFILEYHREFLTKNLDKCKSIVIFCSWNPLSFFENGNILMEYFPELRDDFEKAEKETKKADAEYCLNEYGSLRQAFTHLQIRFDESTIELKDPQLSLNTIRGITGVTLIHYAVDRNDQQLYSKLVEADCDVDALDNEGNHPIHYVKSLEMFDFLVENHSEGQSLVHRKNNQGLTVLHKVCSSNLDYQNVVDLVHRIVTCGADVNQLTNNGESLLFNVASHRILEDLGVSTEVVNQQGETAIQRYLSKGFLYEARVLLPLVRRLASFEKCAHMCLAPFVYSNRDYSSLHFEDFIDQNPETAKLIFDSLYNHSREEASQLFTQACNRALNYIVKKFLDFGYDLDFNCTDEYGNSPILGLLSYMEQHNGPLIKRLLEKGVDLELRNQRGRNALLTLVNRFPSAKWYGHGVDTVQLLLDHGAQIDAADGDGNTALHLAFKGNEYELVGFLVQNGADLTAVNSDGKKPLEMGSSLNKELFYFMI